jgi:hypothetical protein
MAKKSRKKGDGVGTFTAGGRWLVNHNEQLTVLVRGTGLVD